MLIWLGIEIKLDVAQVPKASLLGYDVIEGECSISTITNWDTDQENLINPHLISNGLIAGLAETLRTYNLLRQTCPNAPR